MAEFFEMGGYARYVWAAYGLTALVVAGLALHAVISHGLARRRLRKAEETREEQR